MTVYVASVTNSGGDHYTYVFKKKPTYKKVARKVWQDEGECEDLEWYEEALLIEITAEELLD